MAQRRRPADVLCVDGYVRVSRVGKRHGPRFISPSVQRESIEAWCARQGFRLLAVFEELDESGARRDRPLLEQAVRRIEEGVTEALVVWRVDRFGRSLTDGAMIIDRIQAAGGGFYSVQDGLDISTDAGRLVLRILLSVGEYQLDGARAGWEIARERAIRRGVHLSHPTPVGYRKTRSGRLRPDPITGRLITELYRQRAAGASLLECSDYLERHGVLTGKGNKGWSTSTVSHMMRSRVYLGEVFSGPYRRAEAHPALTDATTWLASQRGPIIRRDGPDHALLAGLARCASCRHCLQPYTARPPGKGPYRLYRCRKRHAAGLCIGPAIIVASKLEEYVIDVALQLLRNRRRRPAAALAAARSQAVRAEAALGSYRDNDHIAAALGQARFLDGLRVRQERARDATLEVLALEARSRLNALPSVTEARRLLRDLPVSERRSLLSGIIDMAFVSPGRGTAAERVIVCPAGTAPRRIPRSGDRGRVNLPIATRRDWITPTPS